MNPNSLRKTMSCQHALTFNTPTAFPSGKSIVNFRPSYPSRFSPRHFRVRTYHTHNANHALLHSLFRYKLKSLVQIGRRRTVPSSTMLFSFQHIVELMLPQQHPRPTTLCTPLSVHVHYFLTTPCLLHNFFHL